MAKKTKTSPRSYLFAAGVGIALGVVAIIAYQLWPSPKSAAIDIITSGTSTSLQYGQTTLSGTIVKIQKDASDPGTYYLSQPESDQPIMLDAGNIEKYRNANVTVSGMLVPATDSLPITMYVESINTTP